MCRQSRQCFLSLTLSNTHPRPLPPALLPLPCAQVGKLDVGGECPATQLIVMQEQTGCSLDKATLLACQRYQMVGQPLEGEGGGGRAHCVALF